MNARRVVEELLNEDAYRNVRLGEPLAQGDEVLDDGDWHPIRPGDVGRKISSGDEVGSYRRRDTGEAPGGMDHRPDPHGALLDAVEAVGGIDKAIAFLQRARSGQQFSDQWHAKHGHDAERVAKAKPVFDRFRARHA